MTSPPPFARIAAGVKRRAIRLRDRWRNERAIDVPHRWLTPPFDATGDEICLFVTWSPDGRVPPHAARHARAWADQGFRVVLIVCLDGIDRLIAGQDLGFADAVLLRENRGYDFGAWATAIATLPGLAAARRVVTVNDSVYGPLDGFAAFVARLRGATADVVGAVESLEHRRHFQSFLLAFGPDAVASPAFHDFWHGVRVGGRDAIIATCELPLLDRMQAAGLSVDALFPASALPAVANPTLQRWHELIEAGFPFIKVQLLRDNPFVADIGDWREVMTARGYDPDIVIRHLGREPAAPARR